MNSLLALSISNSVTEIGALAAFAALLGIAILSLLVFSQAREIKRLREWAGRAPERAAEMEQRVSADAAARLRGAPTQPGTGQVAPVRVVPRKTPLVSAPVSTAVNATVAAVVPSPASPPVPASTPAAPAGATSPDAVVAASSAAAGSIAASGAVAPSVGSDPKAPASSAESVQPTSPQTQSAAAGTADRPSPPNQANSPEQLAGTAPATAAARAANAAPRAPLPPSPAAPAPPGAAPSSAALTAAGATAAAPKPASRPPAPVAASRGVPSRAVAASGDGASPRSSPPVPARASVAATSAGARAAIRQSEGAVGAGPKYFKPERSPRRIMVLIGAGVIVGVLVLVFAISALKGGGSTPTATHSSPTSSEAPVTSSHKASSGGASRPAETAVVVLNGTSTPDLAHHLAADLQQSGYTLAAASAGVPPGAHATTEVQYTHGHHAEAQAVAKALNVTQVHSIESTIGQLAGAATVVVLAGADQASQLGGPQSNGEPATGAGAEGAPAGQ